jgi:hypothetical protein
LCFDQRHLGALRFEHFAQLGSLTCNGVKFALGLDTGP